MLYTAFAALCLMMVAQGQDEECSWVQDMFHGGGWRAVSMDRCNWMNSSGVIFSWKYSCFAGNLFYSNYTGTECTSNQQSLELNDADEVMNEFPDCSYHCGSTSCVPVVMEEGRRDYSDADWAVVNGGDGHGTSEEECGNTIFWDYSMSEIQVASEVCVNHACIGEYGMMMGTNTSQISQCTGTIPYFNNYTQPDCAGTADYSDNSGTQYECWDDGKTTHTYCAAPSTLLAPVLALGALVAALM